MKDTSKDKMGHENKTMKEPRGSDKGKAEMGHEDAHRVHEANAEKRHWEMLLRDDGMNRCMGACEGKSPK